MSFYIKLIAIFVISGCVAIDVAEVPKNINNLFSFERDPQVWTKIISRKYLRI